jgi:uncharacterized membrane protein
LKTKILIILIIVVSATLRIYDIEQKNLWFDEVYSWKISQGSIIEIVSETSGDIHPPFYYIVLKFWMSLFSDSIFAMRMLSVALSILSIYFIYRISKLFLENDFQIILVLILYSVCPLNIFYSQEVRMLNLNLLLCLGSVYYFLTFIKTGLRKAGVLYIVFTVLALYTHYFAFLIFFTEMVLAVIYFLKRNITKITFAEIILYFALVNILYIPWYPVFIAQTSKGQPWRTSQTVLKALNNIPDYFKDVFLSPYFNFESNAVIYFSVFFILIIVTFIIYVLFRILNPKHFTPDKQNPLILFFIVPLFTATLISLKQSIVLSRYLSIILPYLFIMLVYYAYLYLNKKTAAAFIFFLILTGCFGTHIYYNNSFKNNDYRNIISYLEKNFKKEDEIIAEPHFMGWILNYNKKHNTTVLESPVVLGWDLKMQLDSLNKRSDLKNIWFILDYSALDIVNYDLLAGQMQNIGFEKKSEKSFYIIPAKVKVEYFVKQENR